MANDYIDLKQLDLRNIIPCLHLFRAFRIALDLKKIALGATGALFASLGWWVIGTFVFTSPSDSANRTGNASQPQVVVERDKREILIEEVKRFPWQRPTQHKPISDFKDGSGDKGSEKASKEKSLSLPPAVSLSVSQQPKDYFQSPFTKYGWANNDELFSSAGLVLEPVRRFVFPARVIFSDQNLAFPGILLLAWTLIVWSVFGGAITRIAAVQVARDGHVGLRDSLRFVFSRYLSYLTAPILPLIGVIIIVLFCMLGGLLARFPVLDIIAGILWFLTIAAGLVMAIALLVLTVGWPMMYCAISAEATESFDALSRAISYVLGRHWKYLFYTLAVLVYGALISMIVVTFGYWVVYLSQFAVSLGGGDKMPALYANIPTAGGWRADLGVEEGTPIGATANIASWFVAFWCHLVFLAILGFIHSFFWSSMTIVYFLLRKDVDETEMEEVFIDEEEEEPFPTITPALHGVGEVEPPPAVGIGSSLPIIEPPR